MHFDGPRYSPATLGLRFRYTIIDPDWVRKYRRPTAPRYGLLQQVLAQDLQKQWIYQRHLTRRNGIMRLTPVTPFCGPAMIFLREIKGRVLNLFCD